MPVTQNFKDQSNKYPKYKSSKLWNWKRVLIVDDLAFNITALKWILEKNFDILPDKAFTGEQAIQKVQAKVLDKWCKFYDLIIMDYYMPPGMNGSQAAVIIKKFLKPLINQYNTHKMFLKHGGKNLLVKSNSSNCEYKGTHIVCLTSQRESDFEFKQNMVNFDECCSKPMLFEKVKELVNKYVK